MALFKVSKGATGNLSKQSKVDGYCWFTPDDGKFYIDSTTSGSGTTLQRIALNAERADRDKNGNLIHETYAHGLTYNSTSHQIVLTKKDGTTLATATLGAFASANSISTSYQPAGSNSQSTITISATTTNVFNATSNAGTLPSFSSSVSDDGVLSFSFNRGGFPTYSTTAVWNGYDQSKSHAAAQTFTGTATTLTLTPVTGGAQNGDNVDF